MKNNSKFNRGFIVPLLIAIIAVLVIAGGVYVYTTKHSSQNSTSTTTSANPVEQATTTTQTSGNIEQATSNSSAPVVVNTVNPVTSMTTTYTNSQLGLSLQYPAHFTNSYASLNNVSAFATQSGSKIDANGCYFDGLTRPNDSQITVNNIQFCQSNDISPGAGTDSGNYYFTIHRNGEYITLAYEVGYPNGCGAVEGTPEYQSCESSLPNAIDNLISVIQKSAGTLTFTN